MAKNKTEIHVTTVFDGELDATDVFVSLIAQKHTRKTDKEYLAKTQETLFFCCPKAGVFAGDAAKERSF